MAKKLLTKGRVEQIKRAKKNKVKKEYPNWALANAGASKWSLPDSSLYRNQSDLYRRVAAVTTATDMICKVASPVSFNVSKMSGEEESEIDNHPFESLLMNPNPHDSGYEFLDATFKMRVLAGNCYWWLNTPNENAEPTELWILPPDRMRPVPDENMYLNGYMYDPGDGREIPLNTWEVVHFKRYNPFNPFVGLSAIESLAVTAIGDIGAREWNARLFGENNARLPGILAFSDSINNPEWQRMLKEAEIASDKRQQLMLRGVGKGGVQWLQSSATQREMEFLSGLKANEEQIYSVLAPGLSSMLAVNSNEANARVGEAVFRNHTVYPILAEAAAKITKELLPRYGDNLKGEFEDIRISDRAMELQEIGIFSQFHTIDEVRTKFYKAEVIGDERGELLVSEVGSAKVKDEEPEPETTNPKETSIEQDEPEEEAVKAYTTDLNKWKRKAQNALKKTNNADVDFDSDTIPPDIYAIISSGLKTCKTTGDITSLFAAESDKEPKDELSSLISLVELGIKEAIK